ncbi:LOW QUALITY PROTEIN: hypothetical protein HID58_048238, partial [Brassica napus]
MQARVFALNLIWPFFTLPSSLWVIWTLSTQPSFFLVTRTESWIWRKLLKLRPTAYIFMKAEIRNGTSVSFEQMPSSKWAGCNGPDTFANGDWAFLKVGFVFPDRILTTSPPSMRYGEDVFLWKCTHSW